MRVILAFIFFSGSITLASAQKGFNYYRDSSRVGSANAKAFYYFKKAYYDCIWKWTAEGADSAEYYLKSAIAEDSNYAAAYAFLAHVYQFKTYKPEDFDTNFALQKHYAQKAMSLHPKTGDAYSVMSDVAWTEHDTTTSLNLLRQAIAMEPDNVGNYIFLAIRFTQMESADDSAIYYLRKLIEIDPEYGQAYIKMGNVYFWNKHEYDSAKIYYNKAIHVYKTVKPRDNRMMDAYYWLGEMYKSQNQFDSAINYYKLFLREMEPSEMYIRDMRLSATYKSLYDCYQLSAAHRLDKFLEFNKRRLTADSTNVNLMLEVLENGYMTVDQDSVYEKYALPLTEHIQTIQSLDANTNVRVIVDKTLILRRLKRYDEALNMLKVADVKQPNNPLIIFGLALIECDRNNLQKSIAYLKKTKQNLNDFFTNKVFVDQLNSPDFDKLRVLPDFKKLMNK
jgi:tetratricopeptide (TPR) repeat protein